MRKVKVFVKAQSKQQEPKEHIHDTNFISTKIRRAEIQIESENIIYLIVSLYPHSEATIIIIFILFDSIRSREESEKGKK